MKFKTRKGFLMFPRRKGGQPVTTELVNRLRESDVEEYIRDYRELVRSLRDPHSDERKESR